MLKNNDLLPYKERKKSISEFEINLLNQDENYKLELERPMATNQIKNIKQTFIHSFIDDIMCNNKVNNLLYSSNAKKELTFYLKQKKSLLKVVPLKNGVGYLSGGGKKTVKSFSEKQKLEKTYENIKKYIEDYKVGRNKSMLYLKNKNDDFINSQPKLEKKLSKLYYKSINEIRLKGYQKALNKCLDLSANSKKFNMPDVELNTNNVYSRLYNNYILKCKKLKNNNKKSSSEYINKSNLDNNIIENINNSNIHKNNNNDNNNNYKNSYKNKKIDINNSKKKIRKRYTNSDKRQNGKKIIKFKLKSNISDQVNNKQFTIRITPNLVKKCWSSISGGPKPEIKEENSNNEKYDIKKRFNYKILSQNYKNGDKKDISLFNTMIINDPNLDEVFIKNKNYRDDQNNSNLHIAVKNNSIELVKYFLDKNYNLNDINKYGQTALHIACEQGNEKIIDLLLEKGADINIKDNKGRKPYDLFPQKNNKNE